MSVAFQTSTKITDTISFFFLLKLKEKYPKPDIEAFIMGSDHISFSPNPPLYSPFSHKASATYQKH
jgi:hypothetical protein